MLSILTGSKSVVLLLIAFTVMLMMFRSKGRKKGLYFIVGLLFIIGTYWIIMNVPVFYDIIGRRFEKMNAGLSGGEGGFSMDVRSLMIGSGLGWFMDKPLLGYGFNGYCILFGKLTGITVYSHSNIIEMLVNSGIIGFCLYYSLTIYIVVKLWKPALHDKESLAMVLFVFTIITGVLDFVVMSYVNTPYIVRMMYTTAFCHIIAKESKTKLNQAHETLICNQ